jgi:hypothetical protein
MSEYEGCDKCKSVGKDKTEFPCSRCIHNAIDHYKPMTNADRIRNMTDEELAIFINSARCDALYGSECEQPYCEGMCGNSCNDEKHIDKHLLQWLQAEVKEGAE